MLKTFIFRGFVPKKLGSNLLVLRLSNVFGLETEKKRPSLTSMIIDGLKRKKLTFDNNYKLYKDFCRSSCCVNI